MKLTFRKISFALALLICANLLSACGGTNPDDPDTSTQTGGGSNQQSTEPVEEKPELDKLPDADYGGYEFNILLNDQDDRFVDIITAGEQTGDLMNDIIYKRNLKVEQKYNITIKGEKSEYNALVSRVRTSVLANEQPYDLYFGNCYVSPLAAEGLLYELHVLPNLDISNPWWDKAALDGLSVNGNVYLATGDISPTSLLTSSCMTFNKRLLDDAGIEYPYDLVYDNKWTIDKLAAMTADLSRDVNGDDQMKLEDDVFGYTSWMCDSPYSFFYGAGGTMSVKDKDDTPEVKFDVDKITRIYDYIYKIIISNKSYFVTDAAKYDTFYQCFADGKAYFSEFTLQKIEMFLREMNDDFGIIPIPKFDENQEDYLSCVNGAGGFVVVPKNATDPGRTGMIMEALGAGAYDGVTNTLYEVITKTKAARDEESSDMVDIIIRNRVFDFYYINLLTGFDFMQSSLQSKSDNIITKLESIRTPAVAAVEKLVDNYHSNIE